MRGIHDSGVGLHFLEAEGVPDETRAACTSHQSSLIPHLCPPVGQASDAADLQHDSCSYTAITSM